MSVNVRAAMLIAQTISPALSAGGKGGGIVNLSTQASMVGLTDHAAYCTSKGHWINLF
jgi:NAD(P)-dependent dehydrogenase (short-subunit alcohol dehydrogenase family)